MWNIYLNDEIIISNYDSGDINTTAEGNFPQIISQLPEIITALDGRPINRIHVDGMNNTVNIFC